MEVEKISPKKYDFILANINRNTIKEFNYFLNVIKTNSILFFSGFYSKDIDYISNFSIKCGLKILYSDLENDWALIVLKF